MEFKLHKPFIALDNLLKAAGIAAHGAEAKQIILAGAVLVNGAPEKTVRKKLRPGDRVVVADQEIEIVATG
jgi:ribosome-associated protein